VDYDNKINSMTVSQLGEALKPIMSYFGAGFLLVAAFKIAHEKQLFAPTGLIGKYFHLKSTEDVTLGLKKGQEDIWNEIASIHNGRKDDRAEIEAINAVVQSLRTEHTTIEADSRLKAEAVASRLDDIEQSILEISQAVAELTSKSGESKDLRDRVTETEDRLHRESTAMHNHLQQVRDNQQSLLQTQDDMVAAKLDKFKEDLKQILAAMHSTKSNNNNIKNTKSSTENKAKADTPESSKKSNKKKK
jgi:chromosome segregation ATPase